MDNEVVKNYFSMNADAWLSKAYSYKEHSYPLGYHRLRILLDILKEKFSDEKINLVDVACGGGDLCISVAKQGYSVTGIDQSEEMLEKANHKLSLLPEEVSTKTKFIHKNFINDNLPENVFDVATSMGFIGYLDNDDILFSKVNKMLKPKGIFIVSCRNRLFNMASISHYTIREIRNGAAKKLIDEIEELYSKIPNKEAQQFVENIKKQVTEVSSFMEQHLELEKDKEPISTETSSRPIKYADLTSINPRQHTPKELSASAEKSGFSCLGFYGAHPHLFIPKLNYLLPPQIFNRLSDSLQAFEKLPISLIWSSCFIGVFQKN
ncbi:MAG: methyltransferase domain-containing protein [Nanoarchaeota archaeon]|nr:methyltransferase domain-containing protein [Nanoarchaeota archaeon]